MRLLLRRNREVVGLSQGLRSIAKCRLMHLVIFASGSGATARPGAARQIILSALQRTNVIRGLTWRVEL